MEAGIGGPFLVNVHLPATLPLLHCQLERETGEGSRSSPLVVQPHLHEIQHNIIHVAEELLYGNFVAYTRPIYFIREFTEIKKLPVSIILRQSYQTPKRHIRFIDIRHED